MKSFTGILGFLGLKKSSEDSRPTDFKKAKRPQKQVTFNDLPRDQLPPPRLFGEVLTASDFRVQPGLKLIQEENEAIGDGNGNNDVAITCAGRDLDLREKEHEQNYYPPSQSRMSIQSPRYPPQVQHNNDINNYRIRRIPSNYSISIYSSDERSSIRKMEGLRKRAKTPVFFIGQLEKKAMEHDSSEWLANQYQKTLPRRRISSSWNLDLPLIPVKRTLRKIKSQESLRDLCRRNATSPSEASDCETLVGSDGRGSPHSSIFKRDEKDLKFGVENVGSPTCESLDKTSLSDQDISLQICLNLLTSKLSTSLQQNNHSTEQENKASSLEILLMIEAYESIRKGLRSNSRDLHVASTAETALDQWIQALYTIYEDCHGIDRRRAALRKRT
ncbi:hypothetical protein ACHAPC_003007 [Botrytis cinerea]|uniref:Mating-type switching protein swi10 n=2 Tax=Botryotinia fuckeliana TaxID=40559 RepID=G2YAP9_BOTF4|nr:hypothetical protein BcDW1_6115 [Botrytis cinerea BcDW1]CCD34290.1 hypothetical protein BofuT4_P026740.1 [Botrytis cinerea T4]